MMTCRGVLFFSYIVSGNLLHQDLHCQDIPGKLANAGAQKRRFRPGMSDRLEQPRSVRHPAIVTW